ncbi:MAG: cytochrome c oxidase assembly protein [Terriglobales bacterium]
MSSDSSNPVPAGPNAGSASKGAPPDPRRGQKPVRSARLLWFLLPIIPLMFGFAFLNIPLFKAFCEHEGIGLDPNHAAVAGVHSQRQVTVLFTGVVSAGLPVVFAPGHSMQAVRVGQREENFYTFYNPTNHVVKFRAIHAIVPESASERVAIMQCFCFTDQTLQAHQHRTLPVIYQVNPGLRAGVSEINWNYTLFPKHVPGS